jgi:hypothetical protein
MKLAILFAGGLLLAGWHLRASPGQPVLSENPQIRIEPVDNGRVRLRVSGRDDWIVETSTFNVIPGNSITRVRADRATVRTAGRTRVADAFELTISATGSLGFDISNAKPR